MDQNKETIRYILQYHLKLNTIKICSFYGEGAASKSAARKWFARFLTVLNHLQKAWFKKKLDG